MRRFLASITLIFMSLYFPSTVVWGAEFQVTTAAELQNALTAAASNQEDDIIKVAQGTYYGNFKHVSLEGKSITLLGGYTAGFASRVVNPSNTILDGAYYPFGQTLFIFLNYGGDIFIEGFEMKNGTANGGDYESLGGGVFALSYSESGTAGMITITHTIVVENTAYLSGGGIYARSHTISGTAGDVIISNNVISGNDAVTMEGGGVDAKSSSYQGPASGKVILAGNVIIGNTAASEGGGAKALSWAENGKADDVIVTNNIVAGNVCSGNYAGGIYPGSSSSIQIGVVTLTNNTITGNTAGYGGGGVQLFMLGSILNVYNNIIWGNTAPEGGDIYLTGSAGISNAYNNDYSVIRSGSFGWTNSGGNIDADPQFIGGGNYHLKPSSLCIDQGTNTAHDMPDEDIDGNPRIIDGDNDGTATVDIGADEFVSKEDFLGTWDGQGAYYRNSETGKWIKLATPANLIAAGDLEGDGIDDLICIFPTPAGVWIRYSSTGKWTKLASTTAKHISSGDMNGDGREDVLATWDGAGVYYRNSISGAWTKIAQPASLLASGDLDGDSKDDPIIIFPTPAGVWVKYSKTGAWSKLSSASAIDIASGDMNGDGRDDLLGTWQGTGVYYRDSISGGWVKMSVPGEQVTAGDLDGDGKDDLIALWTGQGGVWLKYSKTGTWAKLSTPVRDMDAGLMRGGFWGSSRSGFIELQGPFGGYAEGPLSQSGHIDLSIEGPGGWRFAAQEEENLIPQESSSALRTPGPGDPGFRWIEEDNLFSQEEPTRKNKMTRSLTKPKKR